MPPAKRHQVLAAAPTVQQAITYLREDGETTMANAVQTTLDFAVEAAKAKERQAELDKKAGGNISVNLGKTFRDHVYAAAEAEDVDLTKFVKKKLTEFRDGTWTPAQPPREPMGQAPPLAFWNARFPADLWEQVERLAPDRERWAIEPGERVYKLAGRTLIVAALRERFPMPEDEPAER